MGADTTVFAKLYGMLAKDLGKQSEEVRKERRRIAEFIYGMPDAGWAQGCSAFDFNDDDLDAYDELGALGIAKSCDLCDEWFTDWSADRHGEGLCDDLEDVK